MSENTKLYLVIAGFFVLWSAGLAFFVDHNATVRTNNKWEESIANAKPEETHRDTGRVAQQPNSGTFTAEKVVLTKENYARIIKAVLDASTVAKDVMSENDSLRQSNANLKGAYAVALEPRMIHLKTKEIGDLIIQYNPVDSSANVYKHTPPDKEVVTVWMEKPVLIPRDNLATVADIAMGAGASAVVLAGNTTVRIAGGIVVVIGLGYEFFK